MNLELRTLNFSMDIQTLLAMAPPQGGGGATSMLPTIGMFVAIFGIFYFMIIRPQQKRVKEQQALISSVKRGDEVVLGNGMHGKVVEVEEKTILVDIAKNTMVRFDKGVISTVKKGDA
jgi:preprotein translocase subunit YajC